MSRFQTSRCYGADAAHRLVRRVIGKFNTVERNAFCIRSSIGAGKTDRRKLRNAPQWRHFISIDHLAPRLWGIETHDMNATYKDAIAAIGQVREVVSIRQTFSRGLQES